MPALQTTYATEHARWVKGMVLNSEPELVVSREVESAAGIEFGTVAVRGTGDHQVKVPAASTLPLGIAVLDPTQDSGKYDQYVTAAIMMKGVIVVTASVAVDPGDPVYFVPATGVLTNVETSNIQIPNATWETTTAGEGLAALRLS